MLNESEGVCVCAFANIQLTPGTNQLGILHMFSKGIGGGGVGAMFGGEGFDEMDPLDAAAAAAALHVGGDDQASNQDPSAPTTPQHLEASPPIPTKRKKKHKHHKHHHSQETADAHDERAGAGADAGADAGGRGRTRADGWTRAMSLGR